MVVIYRWDRKTYLRCEPDETHDDIWDNRIEVAKRYTNEVDALSMLRRWFGPHDVEHTECVPVSE